MSETQPEGTTEADLREAMRDDRYWDRDNPEREDFVQRVAEGWQRLEELAQARDEARPSPLGGAEPRGAPGPDMPLGRPAVIFIGGAGDLSMNGPVLPSWDLFSRGNPGLDAHYFPHDDAAGVRSLLDRLPSGTYGSLVGHSWGGDTAAEVAAALGREGRQVDNLITIDPVRREPDAPDTFFYAAVRAGADHWTNVNATGRPWYEASNLIAGLGRDYGTGPESFSHSFVNADVSHREFSAMLRHRGADGLSAMDRITRVW